MFTGYGKFFSGLIALSVFFASGCVQEMDLFNKMRNSSKMSDEIEARNLAGSKCAALFSDPSLNNIRDKMVLRPGGVPTQHSLNLNTTPTDTERASIKQLQGVTEQCKQIHADADVPFSINEEILENQAGKLRYGLYMGEIPYSVFNYGMAQAARDFSQASINNDLTMQKARQVGEQKRYQQQMLSNQRAIQSDLKSAREDLRRSNSPSYGTTYHTITEGGVTKQCSSTADGFGGSSVSCY